VPARRTTPPVGVPAQHCVLVPEHQQLRILRRSPRKSRRPRRVANLLGSNTRSGRSPAPFRNSLSARPPRRCRGLRSPRRWRPVSPPGHPLYLFDQQPGAVTGEGWDEPSLPPWHGVWFLVKPNGNQLPWTSNLTTVKLHGHRYLATSMQTGVGWINFPVYKRASACPPG
jgi:hypothetical protein